MNCVILVWIEFGLLAGLVCWGIITWYRIYWKG